MGGSLRVGVRGLVGAVPGVQAISESAGTLEVQRQEGQVHVRDSGLVVVQPKDARELVYNLEWVLLERLHLAVHRHPGSQLEPEHNGYGEGTPDVVSATVVE